MGLFEICTSSVSRLVSLFLHRCLHAHIRMIEQDPFQLDYNVARTVTKDGLFTVSRHPLGRLTFVALTTMPRGADSRRVHPSVQIVDLAIVVGRDELDRGIVRRA